MERGGTWRPLRYQEVLLDQSRSMIARLPGDKRIAMGEHLDLVCLLQAAEIERLCEFLEDYKLKYNINHKDFERLNEPP